MGRLGRTYSRAWLACVGFSLTPYRSNRFSIRGRSDKVIPQVVRRAERLNSDQLSNIHITGPDGKLVPLSTFSILRNFSSRAPQAPFIILAGSVPLEFRTTLLLLGPLVQLPVNG